MTRHSCSSMSASLLKTMYVVQHLVDLRSSCLSRNCSVCCRETLYDLKLLYLKEHGHRAPGTLIAEKIFRHSDYDVDKANSDSIAHMVCALCSSSNLYHLGPMDNVEKHILLMPGVLILRQTPLAHPSHGVDTDSRLHEP